MITNDAICTPEIKSRIGMAKAAYKTNKKNDDDDDDDNNNNNNNNTTSFTS
jgi:hypothetical protein